MNPTAKEVIESNRLITQRLIDYQQDYHETIRHFETIELLLVLIAILLTVLIVVTVKRKREDEEGIYGDFDRAP